MAVIVPMMCVASPWASSKTADIRIVSEQAIEFLNIVFSSSTYGLNVITLEKSSNCFFFVYLMAALWIHLLHAFQFLDRDIRQMANKMDQLPAIRVLIGGVLS